MYTIDTSVFARDFDVRDPEHTTCRTLLHQLAAGAIPIIVPLLLLAEIAGTISRERRDPIAGRLAVDALRAQPHIRLILIDDRWPRSLPISPQITLCVAQMLSMSPLPAAMAARLSRSIVNSASVLQRS